MGLFIIHCILCQQIAVVSITLHDSHTGYQTGTVQRQYFLICLFHHLLSLQFVDSLQGNPAIIKSFLQVFLYDNSARMFRQKFPDQICPLDQADALTKNIFIKNRFIDYVGIIWYFNWFNFVWCMGNDHRNAYSCYYQNQLSCLSST